MADAKTNPHPRSAPKGRPIDRLTLILSIVFFIVALAAGFVAYNVVHGMVLGWPAGGVPGAPSGQGAAQTTGTPGAPGAPQPTMQAWNGQSRVNILVLGVDFRNTQGSDASHTDTMMLVTIDPTSKSLGVLSIPRDLWVQIPNHDYAKINTAFFLGEAEKLPGGGPALAMQTVEQVLGVPVQYYVTVDFYSFIQFIDDIGGVTVNVQDPISIEIWNTTQQVLLEPGPHTLPGSLAINYVRNRDTAGSDFDRMARQQQVVLAIRDRVLNVNTLPTLVAKAPQLYQELSSGVHTNLTLNQILQLANLVSGIPSGNIRSAVIGPDQVTPATSFDGQAILLPVPGEIEKVRDQIFVETSGPASPTAVSSDPLALAQQEAARISIENGTSQAGLASRTGDFLRSKGLNIISENNGTQIYANTTLVLYKDVPFTLKYLADLMSVKPQQIVNQYDPNSSVDVQVIIGNDWASKNNMP